MSLVNFSPESIAQLRAILGSFGDDEIAREIKSTVPYIESRYFQVSDIVEIEVEDGDNYNEYKAFEVLPDGTPVDSGIVFDSDAENTFKPSDPVYFDNLRINDLIFSGSVELGYAYQVEAVWPDDASGEIVYYIIPKGGGGGGDVRLSIRVTDDLEKGVAQLNGADVINYDGSVVTSGVSIIQNLFGTAKVYSGEILYGFVDPDGNYALDKALLGI